MKLNFSLVHTLAGSLTPAGPKAQAAAKRKAVEEMRYAALEAVDQVYAITGLAAAKNLQDSELLILDRASWVKANTQSFEVLLAALAPQGLSDRLAALSGPEKRVTELGGAAELGGVLAFLSTRVLGQYDPYAALAGHGAAGGRLMIVAPNLMKLEEELKLNPADFRLWVALHEQTHRVQFAAAPWLRDHLLELMASLGQELGQSGENLTDRIASAAASTLKGMQKGQGEEASPETPQGGAALLLSDQGREVLDQITSIMSLLEGHANVVMDSVDPSLIPSVKTIRRRFEDRSKNQGFLPRFMGKLLGMDAKMAQYRNGQKFVQAVVDQVGMELFNQVWLSAQNLPRLAEIQEPDLWVRRVLPSALEGLREEDN